MLFRPQQVFGFGSGLARFEVPFVDDFEDGGNLSNGAAAITSGTVFAKGWRAATAGGGTITNVITDQDAATHGIYELAATANASSAGMIRGPSSLGTLRILGAGQRFRVRWRIRNIPTSSTPAERGDFRVGWFNTATAVPTDGVFWHYSDNVNGGLFRGVAMKASVATNVDSGIAVTTGTPFEVGWDWDSVLLSWIINNTVIGTTTAANLPAAGVSEAASLLRTSGAGATTLRMRLDYYAHDLQWGDGR